MLTTKKALVDSGYRNYARRVPDGCVLHLPHFRLDATVQDYSGNNNNGTPTGIRWDKLSTGSYVMYFAGAASYVLCGTGASLNITGTDISVEAWIKLTNITTTGSILDHQLSGGGGLNDKFTFTNINPGKLSFQVSDGANWDGVTSDAVVFSNSVWAHVFGTQDSSGKNIYVNGALDKSSVTATTMVSTARNTSIGSDAANTDGTRFNGQIAFPRLYNVCIPASTVLAHFNAERRFFR